MNVSLFLNITMPVDIARMALIWSTHPLFRLIWSHAFDRSSRLALLITLDGAFKVTDENQLQSAVNNAVIAGWKAVAEKTIIYCEKHQIQIDQNEILFAAAYGGHIQAMRGAVAMGATRFNWALMRAAEGGRILAMREAVRRPH